MKHKIATLALLAGLIVGVVLEAKVRLSHWFAFVDSEADVKEEGGYQGRPASSWIWQLQDRSPAFRQQAVQALEQLGVKEEGVVPALAGMLKDPNKGVRIGAVFALRRLGACPAIAPLIAALQDEDWYMRLNVVRALGRISPHDPAVLAALVAALQDKSAVVRLATLNTLGEIGPPARDALSAGGGPPG